LTVEVSLPGAAGEFFLAQDAITIDIQLAEALGLLGGFRGRRAAVVDLGIGGLGASADTSRACATACGLGRCCEGKAEQGCNSGKFGLHDE
jgi:hypothetical protein